MKKVINTNGAHKNSFLQLFNNCSYMHLMISSLEFFVLTDFSKEKVIQLVRMYFLMFLHRYFFFEECSNFDTFFFVGKISNSWRSRSKNVLTPHVINLSVCLFNILFGCNFRKNGAVAKKI